MPTCLSAKHNNILCVRLACEFNLLFPRTSIGLSQSPSKKPAVNKVNLANLAGQGPLVIAIKQRYHSTDKERQ
jgi:hypothetical protein